MAQPKCIHCGKTEGEHLAKTSECPTGLRTRIGYISFGPTKFEPKPTRGDVSQKKHTI